MKDKKGQKLEVGDKVNIHMGLHNKQAIGTISRISPTIGDTCVTIINSNFAGYIIGSSYYIYPWSLIKIDQDEIVEDNVEIANIFNYNFG